MCHPVIFDLNFGQLSLFVKPQISDYIRAKTSPPSLALLSYFMRSWPRVAFRATTARISRAVSRPAGAGLQTPRRAAYLQSAAAVCVFAGDRVRLGDEHPA